MARRNEKSISSLVRTAAERGFDLSVVPQGGKKPLVRWKRWQTERPSLVQLERWERTRRPNSWGLACGMVSMILVLDFDGDQGIATMKRLGLKPKVKTPRGFHVWIECPGYPVVGAKAEDTRKQFPGMELKADRQLATFYGPDRQQLPGKVHKFKNLPLELQRFIKNRKRGEGQFKETKVPSEYTNYISRTDLLDEALERSRNGSGRNETGFQLACALRDERYGEAAAWKIMLRYQQQVRGTPGRHLYSKREAYDSLQQAYSRPPRPPRSLQDGGSRFNQEFETMVAREKAKRHYRNMVLGESKLELISGPPKRHDPPRYVIAELAPEDSTIVVVGEFKVGKTTFGLNIARALLSGKSLAGRFSTRFDIYGDDASVAYFNYEVSLRLFEHWAAKISVPNADRFFRAMLRGERTNIMDDEFMATMINTLLKANAKVAILDPWARMIAGVADENSNADVAAYLERLDHITKQADVRNTIIIAHAGAGGWLDKEAGEKRSRGATRLSDWADVIWTMSKQGETRLFSARGRDVEVPQSSFDFDKQTGLWLYEGDSRAEVRDRDRLGRIEDVLQVVLRNLHTPARSKRQLIDRCKGPGVDTNLIPGAIELGLQRGRIGTKPGTGSAVVHFLSSKGSAGAQVRKRR